MVRPCCCTVDSRLTADSIHRQRCPRWAEGESVSTASGRERSTPNNATEPHRRPAFPSTFFPRHPFFIESFSSLYSTLYIVQWHLNWRRQISAAVGSRILAFSTFFVQLVNHLINVQEGAISCVCPVASSFYSSLLQHIFVIYFFVALSLPIAASSKNDFCTDREEPMVQWSDRKASIRS